MRAVAAAAGCTVARPNVDEGVDLQLMHRSDAHAGRLAILEVQMKATTRGAGDQTAALQVRMSKDRHDYFRDPEPTVPRIVAAMSLPGQPEDWITADHDALLLRHAVYWTSLRGAPEAEGESVTVTVPRHNLLDDLELCAIMCRIGQGGAP